MSVKEGNKVLNLNTGEVELHSTEAALNRGPRGKGLWAVTRNQVP